MFASRLKTLRKERNFSRLELSCLLSISKNDIAMFEQGKKFPDETTLNTLAGFFCVSIEYLLNQKNILKKN
ncbi:MAG: helix-turn-helix domain-containing protein [Tissierellales bacterium]|jgi:transcriptional regulator with XRE-family HTH domain|nr:helix-turn-helix domain-containing protein [Tissierellales bacterium]